MPKGYKKSDIPFQTVKKQQSQLGFTINARKPIKKEFWYEEEGNKKVRPYVVKESPANWALRKLS